MPLFHESIQLETNLCQQNTVDGGCFHSQHTIKSVLHILMTRIEGMKINSQVCDETDLFISNIRILLISE